MEALPDLEALADADEQTLLKLWEGLGYYNRVRNLQKAARQALEEFGGLPDSAEKLMELPGLGPLYRRCSGIDRIRENRLRLWTGNVLRVITRLMAYGEDISKQSVRRKRGTGLFSLWWLKIPLPLIRH